MGGGMLMKSLERIGNSLDSCFYPLFKGLLMLFFK